MSIHTPTTRIPFKVIWILLAAVPVLAAIGCSDQETSAPEAMQPQQAPAAQMAEPAPAAAPPAAAPAPVAARDGKAIYDQHCVACHAPGVAGAPKFADKEAWAPRIAKGNDVLLQNVKKGLNAMPAMGTCMSCSDDELRNAIEYMVSHSS